MSGDSTVGALDPTLPVARGTNFLDRIRRAFDMLLLRTDAIDAVLADTGAFLPALAIVALAGAATAAGAGAWLGGYLGSAAAYVLLSLLLAAAVHLGATMGLKARADFVTFYRGLGSTYLLIWVAGIPIVQAFFTWMLLAWQLAVMVLVAERCYRIERVQAAAVVCIPAIGGLFLALLVSSMLALASVFVGWIF